MSKDSNTLEVEIKAFTENKIKPGAKLYVDTFRNPPWNENWTMNEAEALLDKITKKKRFIGFTADYNGTAVGYLLGYRLNSVLFLNQIYYLNELFVNAEFQNMKIGKKLVHTLMNEMSSKKVPFVALLTKKNTYAEMFYKRMGFKRILPGLSINKRIIMCYRLR